MKVQRLRRSASILLLMIAIPYRNAIAQEAFQNEPSAWRYGLSMGLGAVYENLGSSCEAELSYAHLTLALRISGMLPDGGNSSALDLPREELRDIALLIGYQIRSKKGFLTFGAGPSLTSATLRGPVLDSTSYNYNIFGPGKTQYFDTVRSREYGLSVEAKGGLFLGSNCALGLTLFSVFSRSLVYSGISLDIMVGLLK